MYCQGCHQPATLQCPTWECDGYRKYLCKSCAFSYNNRCRDCGEVFLEDEEIEDLNELARCSNNWNMKVVIKKSKNNDTWYTDRIGEKFDVYLRIHPTFGYYEYILKDTKNNRDAFKEDELTLMMLEHGFMGIKFIDAEQIEW